MPRRRRRREDTERMGWAMLVGGGLFASAIYYARALLAEKKAAVVDAPVVAASADVRAECEKKLGGDDSIITIEKKKVSAPDALAMLFKVVKPEELVAALACVTTSANQVNFDSRYFSVPSTKNPPMRLNITAPVKILPSREKRKTPTVQFSVEINDLNRISSDWGVRPAFLKTQALHYFPVFGNGISEAYWCKLAYSTTGYPYQGVLETDMFTLKKVLGLT